ncbi:hypothetical protein [Levilactobacillus brevis]|nr:hypothetical protein [Levilactobacillus brevis]MCM6797870.1 hypothetical protein [Levilactobacillus brevis]MCM6806863.1 hypothetical protein [Levilactobacillus brevis]MCM6812756.1 hypothetical protein [Levilactobacillus brevis]MCM6815154.1 hypothetical protein [Levilactobacillus brevis]MCM6821248.1 hypothetical protein [Levilactobacillus brevis]
MVMMYQSLTFFLAVILMASNGVQEFDFSKKGVTVEDTFKQLDNDGYFNDIKKKYRDPATEYAFNVLEGNQLAGQNWLIGILISGIGVTLMIYIIEKFI